MACTAPKLKDLSSSSSRDRHAHRCAGTVAILCSGKNDLNLLDDLSSFSSVDDPPAEKKPTGFKSPDYSTCTCPFKNQKITPELKKAVPWNLNEWMLCTHKVQNLLNKERHDHKEWEEEMSTPPIIRVGAVVTSLLTKYGVADNPNLVVHDVPTLGIVKKKDRSGLVFEVLYDDTVLRTVH
jgi:hypothetical protein